MTGCTVQRRESEQTEESAAKEPRGLSDHRGLRLAVVQVTDNLLRDHLHARRQAPTLLVLRSSIHLVTYDHPGGSHAGWILRVELAPCERDCLLLAPTMCCEAVGKWNWNKILGTRRSAAQCSPRHSNHRRRAAPQVQVHANLDTTLKKYVPTHKNGFSWRSEERCSRKIVSAN